MKNTGVPVKMPEGIGEESDAPLTGVFLRAGVELRFRLQGRGAPLVLVHGVSSYLEAWEGVAARLEDGFRILSFDLRGHGRSAKVRGRYEIDDFTGDLLALADFAGFDTFHLAGFSLGGLIAQHTALTAPARLRRLALLSTVCGRNEEERARVSSRLAALQANDRGSHYDASLSRWFTDAFVARNPRLMETLRRRNAENDPECYAQAYRVLAETDFGEEVSRIRVPTLIMTGEDDSGSNPRMAAFMHGRIENSKLAILPKLRHSILVEAPDVVASELRAFLSEQGV